MTGTRKTLAVVEPGWWDATVRSDANPREVVEIVEAAMPDHPALERLRQIAVGWEHSLTVPEAATRRCPACDDNGWVEVTRDGRGRVRACTGPWGSGCPAVAWKIAQARESATPTRGQGSTPRRVVRP